METRSELLYSKDHEWIKVEGTLATIGITDFAQDALGDVVFVELPEVEADLAAGDVLSVIESVKAASEVYTPVSGLVVAVNRALEENPEDINAKPYEQWIAQITLSHPEELDALLDESAYLTYCAEEDSDG